MRVRHYGYIHFDYYKMNTLLEIMFKGLPTFHGWGDRFKLQDKSGNNFYLDNEFPYVDIRLYPQDNWKEIISAYVRKGSVGGGIMNTVGRRVEPDDWTQRAPEVTDPMFSP